MKLYREIFFVSAVSLVRVSRVTSAVYPRGTMTVWQAFKPFLEEVMLV